MWATSLTAAMNAEEFVRRSQPFLSYVFDWANNLPMMSLQRELSERSRSGDEVAIVSIDLVEAFCSVGPLASERVKGIVPNVAGLLKIAHATGIDKFVLIQEGHTAGSREFAAFPPHGVLGTVEAETTGELASLPFAAKYEIIRKNSVSPSAGTSFEQWLERHAQVKEFICVGDVTDMCLYQLAMYLNMRANAYDLHDWRIVVPASCTQSYDLPLDIAAQSGALPHDADLFHLLFLYHLAVSGVTVVREIVH